MTAGHMIRNVGIGPHGPTGHHGSHGPGPMTANVGRNVPTSVQSKLSNVPVLPDIFPNC